MISRFRITWLFIAVSLSLLLGACGSGSQSESEDAPDPASPAAAEAEEAEADPAEETAVEAGPQDHGSLTILLGGHSPLWASVYAANALGIFEEEGLDVEIVEPSQGAAAAVAAMVSGSAFVSYSGVPAATNPIREGAPVRIITVNVAPILLELTGSTEWLEEAGITPESSYEEKVKALLDARLSIHSPGDSHTSFFTYLLSTIGAEFRDADVVALQNPANQMSAMERGDIDVWSNSPPHGTIAETRGIGEVFLRATDVPGLDEYPFLAGAVRTDTLENEPDKVKALVCAVARGAELVADDDAEAKAAVREEFSDLEDEVFEAVWGALIRTTPSSPVFTHDAYEQLLTYSEISGSPVDVAFEDMVEVDLIEEAMAECE